MRYLSNKERRKLVQENPWLQRCKKVAIKESIIYCEGKPIALIDGEKAVPTLNNEEEVKKLPKVTIDMGAVPFVTSGADVMRPGIVAMEDFEEGEIVVIVDERHGKALAIGKALFSSDKIREMKSGKVLKVLHHVGDKVWKESIHI